MARNFRLLQKNKLRMDILDDDLGKDKFVHDRMAINEVHDSKNFQSRSKGQSKDEHNVFCDMNSNHSHSGR